MPEKNTVQLYFDRADVIMIAVSSTEVVTDINEKGCEILGYPKDEILGKNWFDNFLPESARENSRRLFHEMLGGSLRHVHYEHPVVSKKGEERVFNWHNILASDTIGNTIGIISSGADVTERRQAEKALAETENRLQST